MHFIRQQDNRMNEIMKGEHHFYQVEQIKYLGIIVSNNNSEEQEIIHHIFTS